MATKRLIDANALIAKLKEHSKLFVDAWQGRVYMSPSDKARVDEIDTCIAEIINAPTVDAVEVVHGRCEYCKDGKSFIGARMLLGNDGKWHDINNCPNCGAKMDGDGNG